MQIHSKKTKRLLRAARRVLRVHTRDLDQLFLAAAANLKRPLPETFAARMNLVREVAQRAQIDFPKVTDGEYPSPPPRLSGKEKKAYQESAPCWTRPVSKVDVNSDTFLLSYEWRRVRMTVLKEHGARCQCCGATAKDGIRLHVDHIKPRRLFPHLALDATNLQVLCEVCNHGKGNWDQTDWRPKAVS